MSYDEEFEGKNPLTEEQLKQWSKDEILKQHFEDKIEYNEEGSRLSRKPNKGFQLGSYKSRSKKSKR